MASDFTASPKPRNTKTVQLAQLIEAIHSYLSTIGISFSHAYIEPIYGSGDFQVNATLIRMTGVIENNAHWPVTRGVFFELPGKACRLKTSRVGPGPLDVFIIAERHIDTQAELRIIADVDVDINKDGSLTFHPRHPPRRYEAGHIIG